MSATKQGVVIKRGKGKVCIRAKWPIRARAYPGFRSMKRLGVFLLPLDGILVHRRVTPGTKFAGTHLYTSVERSPVRVKCLAHEHNIVSPARARTRTARSGDERTDHEATAPPTKDAQGSSAFAVFLVTTESRIYR